MKSARLQATFTMVATSAMGITLYWFPPDRYSFYPRCPVWILTGFECPGCGATRALAALLHGKVVEALQYNALFVCLLPMFFGYSAITHVRAMRHDRWVWPEVPVAATRYLLMIAAAFTVARNVYPI